MMKNSSLTQSKRILLTIYNKNYTSLMFNDAKVHFAISQKHSILILDSKIIGMMKRR